MDTAYKHRNTARGRVIDEDLSSALSLLAGSGNIALKLNYNFFLNGDSSDHVLAGIMVGLVGSIATMLISMLFALPIGIIIAVYIVEFGRQTLIARIIELSARNLASVPSVVIGIFGLSVYIHSFGMRPASQAVGGLTLSIMALPLIVVSTKQALRSVLPAIKYNALALGASPFQVLIHHSLPAAMPFIVTGFILALARVAGETAPLLIIGMALFARDLPTSVFDQTTSLPMQIFLWSGNPQEGFDAMTSAVIVILVIMITILNFLAAFFRKKFCRNYSTS